MGKEKWEPVLNWYFEEEKENAEKFLFSAVRAGCTCCNEDFYVQREKEYAYYTVHILLDGYGFFRIAGREYFLKKGDIFLITPGQAHMYCSRLESKPVLLWAELCGGSCREIFSRFSAVGGYALQNMGTEKIRDKLLCLLLNRKNREENKGNRYEESAEIYDFLMCLLEMAENIKKRPSDAFVQAAEYIDRNFTENISIQKLAESLHISQGYLNRLFRNGMGVSPVKYITMKRMEYACYLLRTTELSCEKISEAVGMYDNAYFYRIFRRVMGMTPVQYKKQGREEDEEVS